MWVMREFHAIFITAIYFPKQQSYMNVIIITVLNNLYFYVLTHWNVYTEKNVNNQSLTQVSQLYVHVSWSCDLHACMCHPYNGSLPEWVCVHIHRVPSGTWKPGKPGDLNLICLGPDMAWNLSPKVGKPGQSKKFSKKPGQNLEI